jgi:hypothetical protein
MAKFQSGKFFSSVSNFWTESVLNEWSTQNRLLTSKDTDLGEIFYIKCVDNFDTFPVSIYTPLSDKWYMSNDLRNSGGAAGNFSFMDRLI